MEVIYAIVPKKVEQINNLLFMENYKSNKINEIRMNNSEYEMKQRSVFNISPQIAYVNSLFL